MYRAVLGHAHILISTDGSLQIDKMADASVAIRNSSDRTVGEAKSILLLPDGRDVDVDLGAEVGLAKSYNVPQASKGKRFIALSVRGDDDLATTPNQFINAEILEVTAIGHVDEQLSLVSYADQFLEQIVEAEAKSGTRPIFPSGVGVPPSQPHIEHGKEERHQRRGIVSHVGTRGGA